MYHLFVSNFQNFSKDGHGIMASKYAFEYNVHTGYIILALLTKRQTRNVNQLHSPDDATQHRLG